MATTGGCWQHYVPAVCDEISGRSEFLTAYSGSPYANLGKFQALFEFQSQMGELVGMDVVSFPTYSWGSAAGNAVRMASRITGRNEALLSKTTGSERLATIRNFCQPSEIDIRLIDYDSDYLGRRMGELSIFGLLPVSSSEQLQDWRVLQCPYPSARVSRYSGLG